MAPATIVALFLAVVPGSVVAFALRLRGITFWAVSIAASFLIIALSSVIAGFTGLKWHVWIVLVIALIIGAVLFALRPFLTRMPQSSASWLRETSLALVPVAVSAIIILLLLRTAIVTPDAFSQSFDNVFHLNAVARILETGNSSPVGLNLTAINSSTSSFYPTLWHAVVALVCQLTSASITLATNALTFVVAAIVWPVAMLFFSAPFTRGTLMHQIAVAAMVTVFPAFPLHLLSWGVLYPNFLSTALLPIALGFAHLALRHNTLYTHLSVGAACSACFGALGAATLAHPNVLMASLVLTLPLLLRALATAVSPRYDVRYRLIKVVLLALPLLAIPMIWLTITTGDNSRTYDTSATQATLQFLSNTVLSDLRALPLTILTVSGVLLTLMHRRHRWLVISWALAEYLYIVAASVPDPFRTTITGLWYNDAHRLAALVPIFAIPLASIAFTWTLELVTEGAKARLAASTLARISRSHSCFYSCTDRHTRWCTRSRNR